MPSRHISSRSFDEILSELGDDPAIPDPHGIRKTERPKISSENSQKVPQGHFNIESLKDSNWFFPIQKLGGFLLFGACVIGISILLLIAYKSTTSSSQAIAEELRKQISELQQELALMRSEFQNDQDNLYEAIDLIEVSIYSLKENKATPKVIAKAQPLTNEAELRRWRYLGTSQMGSTQQAFFQVGKHPAAFEKGALTLGDWRLTQITKESATLSHPQGKSIILKPFKTE
jgi:Rps23 Pro-64 3,4-dihydroxylase Tpa1-like proline 4-hydroxylase